MAIKFINSGGGGGMKFTGTGPGMKVPASGVGGGLASGYQMKLRSGDGSLSVIQTVDINLDGSTTVSLGTPGWTYYDAEKDEYYNYCSFEHPSKNIGWRLYLSGALVSADYSINGNPGVATIHDAGPGLYTIEIFEGPGSLVENPESPIGGADNVPEATLTFTVTA